MTQSLDVPAGTAAAIAGYPAAVRERFLELRALVLDVGTTTEDAAPVLESLRWGQPAYLPSRPHVGTTVRLDRAAGTARIAVLVHCRTTLIDRFRHEHGDRFAYDGTRAIVLRSDEPVPEKELRDFVREAFTYHRRGSRGRTG